MSCGHRSGWMVTGEKTGGGLHLQIWGGWEGEQEGNADFSSKSGGGVLQREGGEETSLDKPELLMAHLLS